MTESLSSTTTAEEDRKTFGQRRINLIWEVTQALIALLVASAAITAALKGQVSEMLGNAFFLVIGFYFGRTNHQRVGGVGARNEDFR